MSCEETDVCHDTATANGVPVPVTTWISLPDAVGSLFFVHIVVATLVS